MRNLQNHISSIIGNVIVRHGNKLIVVVEVLRSLRAEFSAALPYSASSLSLEMPGAIWHEPTGLHGLKPGVRTACCFATVKQRPWGHVLTCRHTAA